MGREFSFEWFGDGDLCGTNGRRPPGSANLPRMVFFFFFFFLLVFFFLPIQVLDVFANVDICRECSLFFDEARQRGGPSGRLRSRPKFLFSRASSGRDRPKVVGRRRCPSSVCQAATSVPSSCGRARTPKRVAAL